MVDVAAASHGVVAAAVVELLGSAEAVALEEEYSLFLVLAASCRCSVADLAVVVAVCFGTCCHGLGLVAEQCYSYSLPGELSALLVLPATSAEYEHFASLPSSHELARRDLEEAFAFAALHAFVALPMDLLANLS